MTPEQIATPGTEHAHQCAFFAWVAQNKDKHPVFPWIHAIKNEEKSNSAIIGSRNKAAGVKAGVADIFVPWPYLCDEKNLHSLHDYYHGLYIEMKRSKVGVQSKEQKDFEKFIRTANYGYCLAYGWEMAVDILKSYLRLEK